MAKNNWEVTTWDLSPGDTIERRALQEHYGGRTQGGIGPSRKSPNVLLFSDRASGEQHGYFDGWHADGCYHYYGEGQRGDQRMISGNASILNHEIEERQLRLFHGAKGTVEYVDEVELDDEVPWYETDAPETGNGPIRKVIVFRLRPKTTSADRADSRLTPLLGGDLVERVPVEEQYTEKAFVDPAREPYEAERREAKLVLALRGFLRCRGHTVTRLKIVPPGETKPLFTDLFDETTNALIEAKGTCTREAMRMAIGQLVDYGRFAQDAARVVLMPEEPRLDLVELAHAQDISVVWPMTAGYGVSNPGALRLVA